MHRYVEVILVVVVVEWAWHFDDHVVAKAMYEKKRTQIGIQTKKKKKEKKEKKNTCTDIKKGIPHIKNLQNKETFQS